jgi:hypothetical protein
MLAHNSRVATASAKTGISVWDMLVSVNLARFGRTPSQSECVCGTKADGLPSTRSWNVPTFTSFAEISAQVDATKAAHATAARVAAAAAEEADPEHGSSLSGAALLQQLLLLRGRAAVAYDLEDAAADSLLAVSRAGAGTDAGADALDLGLGLSAEEAALIDAAEEELFGAGARPHAVMFSGGDGGGDSGSESDAANAVGGFSARETDAAADADADADLSPVFWEMEQELSVFGGLGAHGDALEFGAFGEPARAAGAGAEAEAEEGVSDAGVLSNDDIVARLRARWDTEEAMG